MLVDGGDSERTSDRGAVMRDQLARDMNSAGIGCDGAGHDLDERRFARAVFADERMHFAWAQVERDVFERLHAGERFVNSARLEQKAGSGCRHFEYHSTSYVRAFADTFSYMVGHWLRASEYAASASVLPDMRRRARLLPCG